MPVAYTDGQVVDFARLRVDVGGNAARLEQAGCRRGLLVTHDAYWGAVGLLALLHAGAEAILAPDVRPASLFTLAGVYDRLVCDRRLDSAADPLVLKPGGEGMALGRLDPTASVTVFTSGSTGEAKRVAKTLALLEGETAVVDEVLGQDVPMDTRVHGTVNHQHVYGLAFRLCWPLASGRVFVGSTHELWNDALYALAGGDVLVSSPAHLSRLDGVVPLGSHRQLSLVLSAGSALAEEAARTAAMVFGVPVTEIFGSTETGAVAWRCRASPDPLWHALPGIAVNAGKKGLLRVRSPLVPGDHFEGADRIAMEADGGFRLLGRMGRVVKIEGKRVSLLEVENRLHALPEVENAVVVAVGGAQARLAAAVVLSTAGKAGLAKLEPFRFSRTLRRALAASLTPAALPRQWRFVGALPCSSLGKQRRADIAALFEGAPVQECEGGCRP